MRERYTCAGVLSSASMLRFDDIKFDCALYNGYKPCRYGNDCAGCSYYDPAPVPGAWAPGTLSPQPVNPPADIQSILIIKTGAMGDVLRTTTLLPALARRYPDARVTWITDKLAVPLLDENPYIHELLQFDEIAVEKLAEREFDLLLNYEKERAPLELAGRVIAPYKIGFAPTPWNTATVFNAEAAAGLLLGLSDEFKFRVNQKSYPQIVCEMAGLEYQRDPYVLTLRAESRMRRAEIEAMLSDPAKPRVALNSGCGAVFRTKQWTLEGWVELIEYIQANSDAEILLLGGTAERELNRAIMERTRNVIDTGCDNPLPEFFGVVDACDVMVTSDSLGMHIAVALEKYIVALFGSTSHQEIDLFDRGEKIVTDFACSPCYLKTCDKTPTCMQALRGSVVGEAVLRGLDSLARAASA